MFKDEKTRQELVDLLEARQASLWHACQLEDLRSYVVLGGIPSRALLEQRYLGFTPFQTDATDRNRGVWDKVFLNLSDFGAAFAHGRRATPNSYGPIVFQIAPRALLAATEIAICLRSAGAPGFDREAEALGSCADVDLLFRRPMAWGFPGSDEIRWGDDLQAKFGAERPSPRTPELSLSIPDGRLPLVDVVAVWVDPIATEEVRLIDEVAEILAEAGLTLRLHERWLRDDRRVVIGDLSRVLGDQPLPVRLLAGRTDVDESTRDWARGLSEVDLAWQFDRMARYLVDGTLTTLRATPASVVSGRPFGPLVRALETANWRVRPIAQSSSPAFVHATDPAGTPHTIVAFDGTRRVARAEVEAVQAERRVAPDDRREWLVVSTAGFSEDARAAAGGASLSVSVRADFLDRIAAGAAPVPSRT